MVVQGPSAVATALVIDAPSSASRADPGLLTTKLARPRLPPGYVARPRLGALLDEGTRGPVTLVSAGAGWGKTLSTAAWAAGAPGVGPVAWVSLDATDNQPGTFWSYVVDALRASARVSPDSPLARLVPGLGSDDETLRRLISGLTQLPGPVVLVLDDFHLIDDPSVIEGMTALMRVPVPQLRLVLITRSDPILPLHRLRVAGELGEIRSADLALTPTEAAALVAQDGVALGAGDAELLVDRTEGWPAGLRLAALFLTRDGSGRSPAEFGGDDRAVVEYLAEEVLAHHTPEAQEFLLRTSVAERLNASLAEQLSGQPRGQQLLEELAASNTFVVALGSNGSWFRYHALLRQMLRHRLSVESPDVVPELHRRAAQWFSERGQPLEALHHAADAEDWALMGRLLVTQALPLALSVERASLGVALARIPTHCLADTPQLALAAATRLLLANRFAEMQPHVARAREQLGPIDSDVAAGTRIGLLLFSTAVSRTLGDNAGVIAAASSALDELSARGVTLAAATGYRAIALANLGTGQLWAGRLRVAEQALTTGLAEAEGPALDAGRVNMLSHLALAAAVSGRLNAADLLASQATRIVDQRGWAPLVQASTAYLALAIAHLQRNEVDEALTALAEGRTAAAGDRSPRCAVALFQARLDASRGRVDAARSQLARLRRDVGDWQPPRLLVRWVRITEAEVDLAAADPRSALARVRLDRPEDHASLLVPECLMRARALLDLADPRAADQVLAPLRDHDLDDGSLVETWVLTALVADRLREDRRASDAIRCAVAAAEPERIFRPFSWNPDRLPRILAHAKALHPSTKRFLEELEADGSATSLGARNDGVQASTLTDRELSVVQYLPTMMTYPEIAEQLFVSVNTVKSHVKHVYAKLEVVNRRQAVTRARELGLLSP